jgi:hypothetical protein
MAIGLATDSIGLSFIVAISLLTTPFARTDSLRKSKIRLSLE